MGLQAHRVGRTLRSLVAARGAQLLIVIATSYLALAPLAYALGGGTGLLASAIAAVVCLLAGAGALVVGNLFPGPQSVAIGALAGMLVRMAAPLLFVVIVYSQGGPLVEAGLVFYLLAYYLITLAAETWMSVRLLKRQL